MWACQYSLARNLKGTTNTIDVTLLHLRLVCTVTFHHLETNKYRVLQPAKLESHQACKLQLERALAGVLPVR